MITDTRQKGMEDACLGRPDDDHHPAARGLDPQSVSQRWCGNCTSMPLQQHNRSLRICYRDNSSSSRTTVLWMCMSVMIAVLCVCVPECNASSSSSFQSWNSPSGDVQLQHVAVDDQQSGRVYVGAVNQLYQLTSDLSVEKSVETGPKLDHPYCSSFDTSEATCTYASSSYDKVNTSNHNKVLALDPSIGKLVTCGSVFQGTCELREITDITQVDEIRHVSNTRVNFYVADNSAEGTTVAFIGPGPDNQVTNYALYVGTSYNKASQENLRKQVPLASSRLLEMQQFTSLLDYVYHDDLQSLGTYHKWGKTEPTVIDYKAGFSLDGFSYFFTVDKDPNDQYSSKIISICQNDISYRSYVELPIKCRSASTDYNLLQSATFIKPGSNVLQKLRDQSNYPYIIVGVFAKSGDKSKTPTPESAVCLFDLYNVREKVKENVKACFEGDGRNGCDTKVDLEPTREFCGDRVQHEKFVYGDISLEGETGDVLHSAQTLFTSVALDTVDEHTVAFVGTNEGHLKKVHIKGTYTASEFEDITVVDGQAIKADMPFDKERKHLYVMTDSKLSKVPVETCNDQTTCDSCTGLFNPYCGWCSLEKKCSRQAQCASYDKDKRWLSMYSWSCLALNWIQPEYLPLNSDRAPIKLNVKELPQLEGTEHKYICVFGDSDTESIANSSGKDITCATPSQNHLPPISKDKDHVTITLSIKSSETGVEFLETQFSFYDCGSHDMCSTCTSSQWGCEWCVYSNKCVPSERSNTCSAGPSASVVPDQGTALCPRLTASDEILIPVGLDAKITLNGENLPEPQSGSVGYKCRLHVTAPPLVVPARRLDARTIQCDNHEYTYVGTEPVKVESIDVVWNENFIIEDNDGETVTLYNCKIMGADCSRCISIMERPEEQKYNCRWCQNGCAYATTCSSHTLECPKPQITNVYPLKGPIEGGTRITIEGSNLGHSFTQIQSAVKVAGVDCKAIEYEYKISVRIVCETQATVDASSDLPSQRTGNITVTVESDTAVGPKPFMYQDPKLEDINPKLAPLDGGTRVTLTGSSLDAGTEISVSIGGVQCEIDSISSSESEITCMTASSVVVAQAQSTVVKFDGAERKLNKEFRFTNNPNISSISPLETFISGGRDITVKGTNMDSIQEPLMFVNKMASVQGARRRRAAVPVDQSLITLCAVKDSSTIVCPSPRLTSDNMTDDCNGAANDQENAGTTYTINFIMDGVLAVRNLSQTMTWVNTELAVVPDPVYEKFKGKKQYKGDTLELVGTKLNFACTQDEVKVTIGSETCEIKTLSEDALFCQPPEIQPAGQSENANPVVIVRVGNTCHRLGELEYHVVVQDPASDVWIIAVAVVGGFLIVVIIIILIVYKRKSREAERQYKKMQMQLDTLESNVRNECKQAFAELQTEVSDFTSDINVIGIPFWDYKTYTFKVLFPSFKDHPVLHTQVTYQTNQFGSLQYNSASKGGYDHGLHQFNQLLNCKQFILIFIRTLEQQKNFSIRDKAQVASLMMIVLQDKMEYATDILKALLNELIDRSVEKKHPKLMMRRTESVVEKLLTNWLSIAMYSYLKKHAGKTLFMLFKAIKHQTEKGPIDAITAESRYSLSEDRLLREKVEPKTLAVNLVTDESREPITCKMMDLDTITQAKEKALDAIYMNTPHSRRPNVHDVDLEWRSGRSGHLPLQDEDVTTEVIAGWKKVNTLSHYHVPDGATMALVATRNNTDGVRNVNGMVEITSSLSAITPIMTMEEGTKVWHLVKHDDSLYVSRTQKVISEIFLTRLLATKGTLQQYIDELFLTILRVDTAVPPAIKYLFDFLDQAARRHNILDPDVVHTWKSNSLPLRFWVNIIKNPEFVFDVNKSHIVDSCLSVIAQTFMDSCSTSEHRLGKDSPSNKLLFAKDIPRYRNWVGKFYRGIQEMAPVTEQDMNRNMTDLSMSHIADFNVTVALKDLYKYAQQYSFELLENLDDDPSSKKLHLANKFEQCSASIEGGNPMF